MHLVRPGGRAEALKGDPEIDPADFKQEKTVITGFIRGLDPKKILGALRSIWLARSGVTPEPAAEQLNQTMATDNNEDGA